MRSRAIIIIAVLCVFVAGLLAAQNVTSPDCQPSALASQQRAFSDVLKLDFEANPEQALANLYRLGAAYEDLALRCGYMPNEAEKTALIERILSIADLSEIVAATSVGDDVAAIMAQLDTVVGDPINGQLLYTGEASGLDGSALGCVGCHNGQTAPSVEGTWTRVTEIRLLDPMLADYSVEQYLVESIVHPNAYIVPGYLPNLMPQNYGARLDIQQLADLVAYLDSQDQLLDE